MPLASDFPNCSAVAIGGVHPFILRLFLIIGAHHLFLGHFIIGAHHLFSGYF